MNFVRLAGLGCCRHCHARLRLVFGGRARGDCIRLLLAVACLASSPGCTFIGAAIGGSTIRYEEVAIKDLEVGERTELDARAVAGGGRTVRLRARYKGVRMAPPQAGATTGASDPLMILEDVRVESREVGWRKQPGARSIRMSQVASIRRKEGDHVLTGALFGLTIDVVLIAVVAASASSFSFGNDDSGEGWF